MRPDPISNSKLSKAMNFDLTVFSFRETLVEILLATDSLLVKGLSFLESISSITVDSVQLPLYVS